MSEFFLVRVGEGADSRWLDGMGPDSMFSLTPVRDGATAYTFDQAVDLVNRISYSAPAAVACLEPAPGNAAEGEEVVEVRRRGQG